MTESKIKRQAKVLNYLYASGTSTTDAGGYIITGVPALTTTPTHCVVSGGRTGLVANINNVWCIRALEKDALTLCKNTSVSWHFGYYEYVEA